MRGRPRLAFNDEWIVANYFEFYTTKEMTMAYNKRFGTGYTEVQMRGHCSKTLKMPHRGKYTHEQEMWLSENYPNMGAIHLADAFYEKFKIKKTRDALEGKAKHMGLKCRREVAISNSVAHKRKLGDVWKDANGYWRIRTDTNANGYESLAKHIYRKHYGEIPEGHSIIFLDGNSDNLSIDNLYAVDKSTQLALKNNGFRSTNPTITLGGIMWCELNKAIKRRLYEV